MSMINNRLTYLELKKIITPIIKLDDIEIIKETVYKSLHFTKTQPSDAGQYRICSETTGINSTYKDFEIEIRQLSDPKNGYTGVIIHFKKKKTLIDYFINPNKKFISELKKIIECEIRQAWFSNFDPGGKMPDDVKEGFLYQIGTLNPNWKEENKLSPLAIFTREDNKTYLIEFLFTPECYERKSGKTSLRENWLYIFSNYAPSW